MSKGKHFTNEEVSFVRDNYDSMTAVEVARALGVKPYRVRNLIARYDIKRSEEGWVHHWQQRGENLHKRFESEKRRLRWGLPQETRLWVNIDNPRKSRSRRRLCRKYGFWVNPKDHDEFFIEKGTPYNANKKLLYKRHGFRITEV